MLSVTTPKGGFWVYYLHYNLNVFNNRRKQERDPTFDLTKGDVVEICLWSRCVTEQVAGTATVTEDGPNVESWDSLGCWAIYANNCISHSDNDGIVVACKYIRVDQIPLLDMLQNTESLQSVFNYKTMHCYSNMVPLMINWQSDELEKLTIFGTCIAASGPDSSLVITNFQYKLVPEAMRNFRTIFMMQSPSKEEIAMDSLLEDQFAQFRTYQSTMT